MYQVSFSHSIMNLKNVIDPPDETELVHNLGTKDLWWCVWSKSHNECAGAGAGAQPQA